MQTYISYEEAIRIVLEAVPEQPAVCVAPTEALGRVCARDIRSPEQMPAFDNSAMDGFAVRAEDLGSLPAHLEMVEEVPAGHDPSRTVEPGTCAQITTGAPVPAGADTVVPVEKTEQSGDGPVRIMEKVARGSNVRRAGEDVQEGHALVSAGQTVTPPVIGLLSMLGIAETEVTRVPKVAVVTTGDELIDVSEAPGPGQIRDVNGPALKSQIRAAGGDPHPVLRAGDEEENIRAVLEKCLEADVILVAGGMSVGPHDYVRPVLKSMGMELLFWKVRQRPGKPFGFGVLDGIPVFGLPGNPTTAAICFEMYVRPALAQMLGRKEALAPRFPAVLDCEVRKRRELHYFSRGRARAHRDRRLHVDLAGPQSSGFFAPMSSANCIIHLPEGMEAPSAGEEVDIEWLSWSTAQ